MSTDVLSATRQYAESLQEVLGTRRVLREQEERLVSLQRDIATLRKNLAEQEKQADGAWEVLLERKVGADPKKAGRCYGNVAYRKFNSEDCEYYANHVDGCSTCPRYQ